MDKNMYKISDFSKITKLTVKSLRYYDEEGILIPSFRNKENAYRYYSEADFEKARLIYLLRSLEFSIAEIKEVLNHCGSEADLAFFLEEKQNQIQERIHKEQELIHRIGLHKNPRKQEALKMEYQVVRKELTPILAASIRYMGSYQDVGDYIGKIYKEIKGNSAGAPFNLYYDSDYQEKADIELCVPVKKMISSNAVNVRRLPGEKVISTIHKGSYPALGMAYKTLLDYAQENHLTLKTPSRELYLKGPGMIFKGNENHYLTEVMIPYEEEVL